MMTVQTDLLRAPRYPDLPARMRSLAVDHRGFPIPWFVAWIRDDDGELKPVFPAMDARKRTLAWKEKLCWVCGQKLGRVRAFVIGPMCAINRTSMEPPSHLECARFSALRCPFLSRPEMGRVGESYKGYQLNTDTAGIMLDRNPGVTLVWQTLRYDIFWDGKGDFLFDIGKPHAVEWFARGRPATRAEVLHSISTGIPALQQLIDADPDPEGAHLEFVQRLDAALALAPVEANDD